MKHKILLAIAFVFAITTVVGSPKLAFANSTGTILPTSDGTYLEWATNPFPIDMPHYKQIDESICNGTADFNFTQLWGVRDSYGVDLSSIPNNALITSITITPCASSNVPSTTNFSTSFLALFYRYNGVMSANGENYNLKSTEDNIPTPLQSTNFSGLSIIKTPGDTLEIGAQLVAGAAGARISQLTVSISYIPTTTPNTPPTITTTPASQVRKFSATLNGSANPNGKASAGWFRYSTISPGTCNDTFGTKLPSIGGIPLGLGNIPVSYSNIATGLSSGTLYFYCAIARNIDGIAFGAIRSFTTLLSAGF